MATVVTNAGKGYATGLILPNQLYIGWGTGAGSASAADTALFTEAPEARALATVTQATTATTDDSVQAVGTIQATAQRAITNAGLFDAAASGNLIVKGDFQALPLNAGDSITFTILIQLT